MFNEALRNIVNGAIPMLIIFIVVITTVRISYIRTTNEKVVIHNEILNLLFIIYVLLLFQADSVPCDICGRYLHRGIHVRGRPAQSIWKSGRVCG